jgi:hypothetical protein
MVQVVKPEKSQPSEYSVTRGANIELHWGLETVEYEESDMMADWLRKPYWSSKRTQCGDVQVLSQSLAKLASCSRWKAWTLGIRALRSDCPTIPLSGYATQVKSCTQLTHGF